LERLLREDLPDGDPERVQSHQRDRRALAELRPRRLSRRRERTVRQREPEPFGDDLRRRRRAEELTAAPRRATRAAPHLLRVVERDEVAREARVQALHLPRVLRSEER